MPLPINFTKILETVNKWNVITKTNDFDEINSKGPIAWHDSIGDNIPKILYWQKSNNDFARQNTINPFGKRNTNVFVRQNSINMLAKQNANKNSFSQHTSKFIPDESSSKVFLKKALTSKVKAGITNSLKYIPPTSP